MKIGRNELCPCDSGKKYKKCCLEKNENQNSQEVLKKEVDSFVEQMMDKFEEIAKTGWRGSFLESPVRSNMESLYLQCKYISERVDRDICLGIQSDVKKHEVIYRKAKIIQKLIWNPPEEKVKQEKIFLIWGDYKKELEPNEFVDLIIGTFASIFEYYVDLLKKNVFDCVKLAKALDLDDLVGEISKEKSLEKLYGKLENETKKEYPSQEIKSLFNMRAYQIRCASAHNDYYFQKEKDGTFSIALEGGKDSMNFVELLNLSNDIMAKINILNLIPVYFSKKTLPVN